MISNKTNKTSDFSKIIVSLASPEAILENSFFLKSKTALTILKKDNELLQSNKN